MENQKRIFGRRGVPAVLAALLSGLFACAGAMADSGKIWITVGDAAFTHLQKAAPQVIAKESKMLRANEASAKVALMEKVHLVEVDEEQMLKLGAAIHKELKRCGGFMFHASEAEGRKALAKQAAPLATAALRRPAYVIDNQALVPGVLS